MLLTLIDNFRYQFETLRPDQFDVFVVGQIKVHAHVAWLYGQFAPVPFNQHCESH